MMSIPECVWKHAVCVRVSRDDRERRQGNGGPHTLIVPQAFLHWHGLTNCLMPETVLLGVWWPGLGSGTADPWRRGATCRGGEAG